MGRVKKNEPLNVHNANSMRSWMARLLEMPPDMFEDDDLEDVRWDIAHFFWKTGPLHTCASVVGGEMLPNKNGVNDQHMKLIETIKERMGSEEVEVKAFREKLQDLYNCLKSREEHDDECV